MPSLRFFLSSLSIISVLFALSSLITTADAKTSEDGLSFLAKKEQSDGVVKLDSGLMYKEIRAGTGACFYFLSFSNPPSGRYHA